MNVSRFSWDLTLIDEILEISFAALSTLVYLTFLLLTFRLLHKHKQLLDYYMLASLSLFALSVFLLDATILVDLGDRDFNNKNLA